MIEMILAIITAVLFYSDMECEDTYLNKESVDKIESSLSEDESLISLGEFRLTAYCGCSICCGVYADDRENGVVCGAYGVPLIENYSIAVDPNVIPYGTEVIINGRSYIAYDTGGAISENRIDVYFDNHEDALAFEIQDAEVFIHK